MEVMSSAETMREMYMVTKVMVVRAKVKVEERNERLTSNE
jgi:hypothetical protein